MAQKEAIVIILDVGTSMSKRSVLLEAALKAVTLLVQQKILQNGKDDIGLVLFGTEETNNDLAEDGYNNISVLREITTPDLELLKIIENIRPGGHNADFIDALVVSMDMLQKKVGNRSYQKRVFIVTDAGCEVNTDDLNKIIEQFNHMDARLNVIGVDFDDELQPQESQDRQSNKSEVKINNEKLLHSICQQVKGVVIPIHEALSLMSYFSSRSTLQKSSFRGFLEISPLLKIPVWSFVKTKEVSFPRLQKVSKLAALSAAKNTMAVLIQRTYHSYDDPDKELEPEHLAKGYRYGRTLVLFSEEDEKALKYTSEACLKLIGFTTRARVPRHHYMSNVECIVPLPGDEPAAIAIAALAQALADTNSVAIVRFVKRANSVPQLGVLTPYLKEDIAVLHYNTLPFAEDIRQYTFAPLLGPGARKGMVPNQQQLDAAEDLINALDLMTAAVDADGEPTEALKPNLCYNPALQHFYECVQSRALHPNDPLPKLNPVIEQYVNPDAALLSRAAKALDNFKDCFPLVKSEAKERTMKKRFWSDAFAAAADITLDSYVGADAKRQKGDDNEKMSLQSVLAGNVDEVGTVTPVEDFKAMLKRKDVDLVDIAIEQMKKRIVGLVNDSVKGSHYDKALDCLVALREGCVVEQEAEAFNKFLVDIKKFFRGNKHDGFWLRIVEKRISLITSDEDPNQSDFTEADANAFLETDMLPSNLDTEKLDEEPDQPEQSQDKPDEPDAESLFNMME